MTYKGSWQRPLQVTREERELRHELAFDCKNDPKRARAVKRRIKQLEKERQGD